MHIHVLGAAAGGGFPQWNCNCANCTGVRQGTMRATPRTQSSIAVSADGVSWVLFNTSPDIRAQLAAFAPFQPARKPRDTAIAAIIFMDSQIDHTTGLLMLREGCPHEVYCTDRAYDDLTSGFPIFTMLRHWNGGVNRHAIPIDGSHFTIPAIKGLRFTAIAIDSKPPPYSPRRERPEPGDNIGIQVEDMTSGKKLFYVPGVGRITPELSHYMAASDCLMIDGTLWEEEEMRVIGRDHFLGQRKGADMGHLPLSGEGGMIEALRPLTRPRKILIHINNTNPILNEDSAERAILHAEGIEISYDGLDIVL